jgi:hypothetical protein
MIGIAAGIGTVTVIWIFWRTEVAFPWFALIGTAITFSVGWLLGRGGSPSDTRATSAVGARRAA